MSTLWSCRVFPMLSAVCSAHHTCQFRLLWVGCIFGGLHAASGSDRRRELESPGMILFRRLVMSVLALCVYHMLLGLCT